MSRTSRTRSRKARPRPGAAKLNDVIDWAIGEKAAEISQTMINLAIGGDVSCLKAILRMAEGAETEPEIEAVRGEGQIDKWEKELEAQMALPASEEGAETTASAREPES